MVSVVKRAVMILVVCVAAVSAYGYVSDDLDFVPMDGSDSSYGTGSLAPRITNSLGQEFVLIPKGSFMMGSPKGESKRDDAETQHRVTITKAFYLQTTEVTVGQWRLFTKGTGYRTEAETGGGAYQWTGKKWEEKEGIYWDNPGFEQTERHPVTCVSWNDVTKYVSWINRKEETDKYRLPTEAQWEYACRAGTTTAFSTGRCISTNQANYDGNYPMPNCTKGRYREKTVKVGSFSPNKWGLYNMHGNVWEWCKDWYGNYPGGHVTDPKGPSSGSRCVLRGGGWGSNAGYARSASRIRGGPGCRYNDDGFRVARAF